MAPSVRLPRMSVREGEALLRLLDARRAGGVLDGLLVRLADHMRRAMEPKRKPAHGAWTPAFRKAQEMRERPKKELARARRQDIRTAVFLRAGGVCECGCGEIALNDDVAQCYPEARGEVDHYFGRGAGRLPESEQTCWVLRPACHREKTLNRPDAATWLERFIAHCSRHGYDQALVAASKRRQFVETRSNLSAAPRTR